MKNILVIGATSAIAEHCARLWAAEGAKLFLVGRNAERVAMIADDLRVRGQAHGLQVATFVMDATNTASHQAMLDAALAHLGKLDGALIAHGTLPDQKACEASVDVTLAEVGVNGLSVIALATRLANVFEQQGSGCLAAIGSVAGDRGRQSNYTYGAAKALVERFFEGLRNRLAPKGVSVLLIKPGFVDTPMTAAFDKGGRLWATPDRVAREIVAAMASGRQVLYTPWFWRWILLVIRHIPERIFVRLKL
ncbi:MAG: SDR family oxidoreductase [Sulfuritalea sp.]|nr:SDR family oxidoreductase [Sulfuritalea sp.]